MAFSSQRILPAREWEEAAAAGWWARWRALGCCSLLSGSWRQYTGTLMGRYHLYSSDHRNRNKQMCCYSRRFRKCRIFSTFTFMSSLLLNLFFQMLIVIMRHLLWFASHVGCASCSDNKISDAVKRRGAPVRNQADNLLYFSYWSTPCRTVPVARTGIVDQGADPGFEGVGWGGALSGSPPPQLKNAIVVQRNCLRFGSVLTGIRMNNSDLDPTLSFYSNYLKTFGESH